MADDVAQAVRSALAEALPTVVAEIIAALGRPAIETQIEPSGPDPAALAESVAAAAAATERARWETMAPDELEQLEAAAARTRLADAIVDTLERGGDPGALRDLEQHLDPAAIADCRAEAKRRLARNPAAIAAIDAGLKSRRDELADLIRAVNDGKASAEQRSRLVELVAR